MSIKSIHNLLDTQLATTTNIPSITNENETSSRPQTSATSVLKKPYIRTTLLPARTTTATLGPSGIDRWYGLYQVDIFFPTNDGTDGPDYAADQIISNFAAGTILTGDGVQLRIAQTSWREAGTESTMWYQVPVMVEYEAFIQR